MIYYIDYFFFCKMYIIEKKSFKKMYHHSSSNIKASFLLTFNFELIKHQHFKGSESDFALHYYLPTGKNLDQWHGGKQWIWGNDDVNYCFLWAPILPILVNYLNMTIIYWTKLESLAQYIKNHNVNKPMIYWLRFRVHLKGGV